MKKYPLHQPLLRMKFLARTVFHMTSLICPDGITYAEHVSEVASMKQDLDGAMFNIDEIFLSLQLFYFQSQEDLVYKKVYTTIENLLRPFDDLSQIDHDVLIDVVIRTFEEYGSAKVRALRVGATGSAAPHPGCKGCPDHCRHSNGTCRLPTRGKTPCAMMDTASSVAAHHGSYEDLEAGMDVPVTADAVHALVTRILREHKTAHEGLDHRGAF